MSHAKLSPSAAERWMTCPGSVVLSEGMPNRSSKFADEGTLAHALGEACLLDELPAQAFAGTLFEYDDHGDKKSELITLDMASHVQTYVDYVVGLGGEPHTEQKVAVNEHVYGTGDAVVWRAEEKALHIVDLKYGAGLPVEIEGNLQLKIYALATLLTFKFPAKTVTATIVQPRCPHSDGPVRSVTYDVVELLDFHADLLDAKQRVMNAMSNRDKGMPDADQELQPSEKGCRWCLAAPKCPALQNKAQDSAKQVFAAGVAYDPIALAKTLDDLPLIEGWIKNVREFAYGEAERGSDIPDWKLVEKRALRKWVGGVTGTELTAKLGLPIEQLLDDPKLKSPAEVEKLLPKEERAKLADVTVKESSGHTLVHESDKRPAVKLDAASAFSKL